MKNGWLIVLMTISISTQGQNLVPNGNLETYSDCPNNQSELQNAIPWVNPTVSSPDYFNACAPPAGEDVRMLVGIYFNPELRAGEFAIHVWWQGA